MCKIQLEHSAIGTSNQFFREMRNEGDNLPIGIILCADKSESVVKYTLPENNSQIFTSKYKLYMPTEEELKQELEKEQQLLEIEKNCNNEEKE